MTTEYYFDRTGAAIDVWAWSSKTGDPQYSQVCLTVLCDGESERVVATVWDGVNRNPGGVPVLFESAVLAPDARTRIVARYETEKDAALGHVDIVAAETARMTSPEIHEGDESVAEILARWAERRMG